MPELRDGYVAVIRHNSDVPGLVQLYSQMSVDAADEQHPAHAFFVERGENLRGLFASVLAARSEAGEITDRSTPRPSPGSSRPSPTACSCNGCWSPTSTWPASSPSSSTHSRADLRAEPGMTITVETPIVAIAAGRVRGFWRGEPGTPGASAAFLGIPFAQAPVGELRFAAPVPPEPWDDIRDALEYGATAQRGDPGMTLIPEPSIPGEATLNVNVFTPVPGESDAALPVLVYIHGGGFTGGSPASPWYDGRAFNRDGVVTVTSRTGSASTASATSPVRRPTAGCATGSRHSSGCETTSPRSAATRHASRSPDSPPAAGRC